MLVAIAGAVSLVKGPWGGALCSLPGEAHQQYFKEMPLVNVRERNMKCSSLLQEAVSAAIAGAIS